MVRTSTCDCIHRYSQFMASDDENAHTQQLANVRAAIDEIDEEMVALIGRRERLVRIAGSVKADAAEVRSPERVEQVVSTVRSLAAESKVSPEIVEATYRAMIDAFIELELKVQRSSF